jgi:hypothetical protein
MGKHGRTAAGRATVISSLPHFLISPAAMGAALLAAAVIAAPARAERLRYRFQPGQVIENRIGMAGASMMGPTTGQMLKAQFRTTVRQSQRVRSVRAGVVTLEVTETTVSGYMTASGQREAMKRTPTKSLVRLTEGGRFISRQTLTPGEKDTPSALDGTDILYGLNFPDRDLKPGDTWEDTRTVGSGEQASKVHVTWKYAGRHLFRGRDCAKIVAVMKIPMGGAGAADPSEGALPSAQGRITGSVTTYFDPKAGVEVYSTGSMVILAKADLSAVSQDGGEFGSITKINVIQSLVSGATGRR